MIRDLISHYDQIRTLGAEILAISTVNLDDLSGVLSHNGPKFPLCADADAAISKLYGVYNPRWQHPNPSAFLIDREGIVRYRYIGGIVIQAIQSKLPRATELVEELAKL